jgi:Protein of unknown function (DUF1236)
MLRVLKAAAIALVLASAPTVSAQTTSGEALSPEQIKRVRAHVVQEKRTPARLPPGSRVVAGAEIPPDIEINSFPAEVGVPDFRYAVIGDQIVLVRRETRRIFYVYGIGF